MGKWVSSGGFKGQSILSRKYPKSHLPLPSKSVTRNEVYPEAASWKGQGVLSQDWQGVEQARDYSAEEPGKAEPTGIKPDEGIPPAFPYLALSPIFDNFHNANRNKV